MKVTARTLFTLIFSLTSVAHAATVNFGGNFRSEGGFYNNPGLGAAGTPASKTFLAGRALLVPNLIIDDHFSIKSQWNLLSSPGFTAIANQALGAGQGSFVFGDPNSVSFSLGRVWLEWTSDVGVFRLGRMPVSWGYGLLYDSGDGLWDDFQTTMDRIEYRLHLGYVVGAVAYSKRRKLSVSGNDNDQEFYTAYLRYDNPEMEVEAGLLFEKQERSATQSADLMGSANEYRHSAVSYPLATKIQYPLSDLTLDVYLKKTSGYFSYGGELSWISGTATNYSGGTPPAALNAFAFSLNAAVDYRKVKAFAEALFASGDADMSDATASGFSLLHRNRRPGLLLGRQLLGNYAGNNANLGTPLAYGASGVFSGILYIRPGVKVDWSPTLTSSVEVVFARKLVDSAGADLNLGLEIDVGTEYAVYKNFKLGADLGVLLPGAGIGVSSPSASFGARTTATMVF